LPVTQPPTPCRKRLLVSYVGRPLSALTTACAAC
jgi:hypothetical protein